MSHNWGDDLGIQITASAHRHGISTDRVQFALEHTVCTLSGGQGMTIHLAYDHNLIPIELGIVRRGNDTVIVHAMKARARWLPIYRRFL